MMLQSKNGNTNAQPVPGEVKKRKRANEAEHNLRGFEAKRSNGDICSDMGMLKIDSGKTEPCPMQENNAPSEDLVAVDDSDVDYDREEAGNIESVSEYACDVFRYYKSREKRFKICDYMANHPEMSKKTRAIMIDWFVQFQQYFELNHETMYLSVKLVDTYLANSKNVTKNEVQLLCTATLLLAAKFDERIPPFVDDIVTLCSRNFNRDELLSMEREVFKTVGFNLGAPLSYRFLRRLARVTGIEMCDLTLARYLLESTLLIYDFCLMSESKVAAACYLLAMQMKERSFVWNSVLRKYSGYTAEEVAPVADFLNRELHHLTTSWKQLKIIREKYSDKNFFCVAKVPFLPITRNQDNLRVDRA